MRHCRVPSTQDGKMNQAKILPPRNSVSQRADHCWEEAALVVMKNGLRSKVSSRIRNCVRSVMNTLILATPCKVRTGAPSQRRRDRGQTGPGASPRPHAIGQPSQDLHPGPGDLFTASLPTAWSTFEQFCSETKQPVLRVTKASPSSGWKLRERAQAW